MRKGERVFIYGGLTAAILLGLGWRGPDRHAMAAAPVFGMPETQDGTMKLATVDILKIVEKYVKSDRYAPAREAFNKDLTAQLEKLRGELESLRTQIQSSPQNAPETQGLIQNFQQRGQEFDMERQKAMAASDEFNARQIAEAYRLVAEIVLAHAQTGGYTHVLASRGGPATLKSTNIAGTVQEMLARPLVKGNLADDLTKGVLDELKLPDIDDEPAATPGAAPIAPTTPGSTPSK